MPSKADPAAFRARMLARLSGTDTPAPAAVDDRRALKNARNKVRNSQRRHALTPRQWKSALARWGDECAYCGRPLKKPQKEHFIPLELGGDLRPGNVVPACQKCNNGKGAKHPLEFMVDRGNLIRYVEIVRHLETL